MFRDGSGSRLVETDSFLMIRIVDAKQVSPQFQCQAMPLNSSVLQVFIQLFLRSMLCISFTFFQNHFALIHFMSCHVMTFVFSRFIL